MASAALKPGMLDCTLFDFTGHYIVAIYQLEEATTSSVICHNGRSYLFDPHHALSGGHYCSFIELIHGLVVAVPMSSLRLEKSQ